jgi:hypothetical protein
MAHFKCKGLSISYSGQKHAHHPEIIQGYPILKKGSLQTPIKQSHVSTSGRLLHWWTSCNMFGTHVWKIRHFKHKHDWWSIFQANTVVWTSLGPLPRWVPGPTPRWAPGTTWLALHGTWRRGAQGLHRSSTRLGSCTCSALYGGLLDVLD